MHPRGLCGVLFRACAIKLLQCAGHQQPMGWKAHLQSQTDYLFVVLTTGKSCY